MRWARLAAHWPLAIPLLVAAWLRFSGLLPGTFYGDAAEYTEVARSLAQDPRDLSYPDLEELGPTPFVSQPPLVLYLFALAIQLTGSVEAGPLAASALLGTATVALVYAIGNLLDGKATGTAAAAFLAVVPGHVRASREAQLDAAFAFFVALAILAFLLWAARPTDMRALGAGLAVAATVFAKLPGIAILLVLAVPLAHVAFMGRKEPGAWQRTARHTAFALAPTALMWLLYAGLLWSLQATSELFAKLSWQAGRVAGEDTVARPWHWYFTASDLGLSTQFGAFLLAAAVAGAIMAGLVAARDPARRTGILLLLAWPTVFLALLAASQRKEWFYAVPVAPALALLAAWPVGALVRWARAQRPSDRPYPPALRRRGLTLGAVAIVASAAAWAPLATSLAGPGGFGQGVREAAHWIHEEDPDAAQVGTTLGRFTLHLFNGQPTYHYWLNHTFVEDGIRSGRVRYVVLDTYVSDPGEQAWLAGLVQEFHGEPVLEHRSEGAVRVWVYRLAPSTGP